MSCNVKELLTMALLGLHAERVRLDLFEQSIYAQLEEMANAGPRPVDTAPARKPIHRERRRKHRLTDEGRQAIADAARRRWAKIRKAKKAA